MTLSVVTTQSPHCDTECSNYRTAGWPDWPSVATTGLRFTFFADSQSQSGGWRAQPAAAGPVKITSVTSAGLSPILLNTDLLLAHSFVSSQSELSHGPTILGNAENVD